MKNYPGVSATVLFGLTILIAGCDDPNAREPSDGWQLHWKTLSDGSSFAQSHDQNGAAEAAIRCWPSGKGYSCLSAGHMKSALDAITIARSDEAKLPEILMPYVSQSSGYSCGKVIDANEAISRNGKQLTSNVIKWGEGRWSKSHVTKFMRDNSVSGPGYYACLEVLEAVWGNSLETLGTTAVTRRMAGF